MVGHHATESSIFDALTVVQQEVLLALVAGQSISGGAKAAGIHQSTVLPWTQHFQRLLTDMAFDTIRHNF